MNPEEQITKPDSKLDGLEIDSFESVDDFIKELEAKEKDLHITADLTIEIEESDFDPDDLPAYVAEGIEAAVNDGLSKSGNHQNVQNAGATARVKQLEKEVERLKGYVAELKAERQEVQEDSERRLKDFQSFKYRVERERRGSFIDQLANLATQMLPVLDNLDRALDAAENSASERSEEFQQFYEGIVLVNQQVNEVLTGMGVSPIATIGERFDPVFHEAVATEQREDLPNNTVSQEILRGFRIGNRVVRHSLVKVVTSTQDVIEDIPPAEDASQSANDVDAAELDLLADLDGFEFPDDSPAPKDASSQEAE